ncbi:MAG: hypothetical protein ABFD16_12360 [Thermoguttaceae bacterium]|jgi:predicted RNA-binding Zn-ribbon protein involved in translation (DUF1610 family)
MREDFSVIYQARTAPEANELTERLVEAGIEGVVVEELVPGQTGTDPIGLPSPFSVAVHQDQVAAAREVAEKFDDELFARAQQEEEQPEAAESAEAAATPGEPDAWPRCPQCGQRRVTVCPVCKTSGTHFPQADKDYSGDADSLEASRRLLLCPTCDEPFVPQYLRHCEWCDHDFGEGLEPHHDQVSEQLSPQVMAALFGLVALVIGILVYFMIIL